MSYFKKHIAKIALIYAVFLYAAWIGAWLLERRLEQVGLPTSGLGNVAYWTAMKLLLWVAPSVVIIRLSGRSFAETMGFRRIGRAVLWGVGTGLILALLSVLTRLVRGQSLVTINFSWPLVSGTLIAPVIEEITFRGAVLGALQTRLKFLPANAITAALFMGAHLPGWYFQGVLVSRLLSPLGGALSILVLGFVFGCVAKKSNSVLGSIFTHMLNNLFSM